MSNENFGPGAEKRVVKGASKGLRAVITGYRARVDGEFSSRTFAPDSLEDWVLLSPPPPPAVPVVEFLAVSGGAGFIDYQVTVTDPQAAHEVIVGLHPGTEVLPKQTSLSAANVSGRLSPVPAGTYSIWAAVRDANGVDLDTATPLLVTVTGAEPPPPPPPPPPPSAVDKDYSADRATGTSYPYPYLQRWSDYGVENTDVAQVNVITSPMDPLRKAYEFFLKTGGQRVEFGDWGNPDALLTEGEKYWFTNDFFIPSNPNKTVGWYKDSHHSFMQLHAAAPVENTIFGVGVRTSFAGKEGFGALPPGGGGIDLWVPEAEMYDKKFHVEIYVEFAKTGGVVRAYLNGDLKYSFNGNTNPSGSVSLKEGLYQSPAQGGNKIVTHGFKRSLTRQG